MLMTFYLNVFYLLTLKQVVIPFTYANDVLQCLYSIADKTSKWCGEKSWPYDIGYHWPNDNSVWDYSLGNEALFGENAGKQCVAMSLTAIIYHQVEHISERTSSDICYIEMDFECFRLALWSTKKPNLKGLRIVHALNMTRTNENHEEFVRDRASCWHGQACKDNKYRNDQCNHNGARILDFFGRIDLEFEDD